MLYPQDLSATKACNKGDSPNLQTLANDDLISRCRKNQRPAWEEFFRRFIPVIKYAIKNQLRSSGHEELGFDQDVVANIHEAIVIKLYKQGILANCTDPAGVNAWLQTVAANQTLDWLKAHYRKKRLPQKHGEQSMISLDAPLQQTPEITIGETIADDRKVDEELRRYLDDVLQCLDSGLNDKIRWVLRLSVVARMSFSQEEVEDLARFNMWSISTLRRRLDSIMTQVEKKEKNRITILGKAVLLWHEIRQLEVRLSNLVKELPPLWQQESERLRVEIAKKEKKQAQFLEAGCRLCRPSNQDIAELVGLPEDKTAQISTLLIRARAQLQKKVGRQIDTGR